jgi:RHS repeat-associated protein
LNDVVGNPIRAWDSRGHTFVSTYDALRRPVDQFVRGSSAESDPRTVAGAILFDRIEYGESLQNAETLNARTRIFRHFDGAGVATNARLDGSGDPVEAFDFKGNLLCSTRRLVTDYTALPDWGQDPDLEQEVFEGRTRYDALNRPVQTIVPHSRASARRTVIQPRFNESNLLHAVDVWLDRPGEPAVLLDPLSEAPSPVGLAALTYDAKGRRRQVDYKNGATTYLVFDPLTSQLTDLYTRRGPAFDEDCDNPQPPPPTIPAPHPPVGPSCGLQNLHYTYDAGGNVTHIHDGAQQSIYFRNQRVQPDGDFIYDAFYRLVQATGREHLGQAGGVRNAPRPPGADNALQIRLDHPGDGSAMGTYVETYVYDSVGNIRTWKHRGSDPGHPGWTREYAFTEPGVIDDDGQPGLIGNRLTSTITDPDGPNTVVEPYMHDAHGNMIRMPHLGGGQPGPNLQWDHRDHVRRVDRGGGGVAYYTYNSSGQRVRKVWEKAPGRVEERIYLDGFEMFRRHDGPIGPNSVRLERETLHVLDDKQRIALVETRTCDIAGDDDAPARSIRHQLGNHLGSASLELDEHAQVVSYEEFAPYGDTTYQAVRAQTETPKRHRFTGKERDEETGLYYHGARYYAPWLGRWTSTDPSGTKDGLSAYEYCGGNPVGLVDPNGEQDRPPPPGMMGNDPRIGQLWERAVVEELGPRFKTTTYQETIAAYKAELDKRIAAKGMGSNRKKGTGINYARESYKKVRSKFGKLAAAAKISLKGIQVHHTFQELAKNPHGALDTTNLSNMKGHAGTAGSTHNIAHEMNKKLEAGSKNPGQDVFDDLKRRGIKPDAPEAAPHFKSSSSSSHAPTTPPSHTPSGSHGGATGPRVHSSRPRAPKKPKGKVGGPVGLLINAGVAAYVWFDTKDAYATVQTVNPAANTTDTLVSGDATAESTSKSVAMDVFYWTPPGWVYGAYEGFFAPRGDNIYDQRLTDRALREGRNPFCAQCHGPGGALDEYNDWNMKRRYNLQDIDLK